MTPQTQERIKADAAKFTDKRYKSTGVSSKEYARHMGVLDGLEEGYIAGATAENERAEAAIDAAIHNERNALQARVTQIDMDWLKRSQVLVDALEAIAGITMPVPNKADMIEIAKKHLEQWRGKKQSEAKEGIIRVILAGAYGVSKDAASAEEYLKSEGVDVAALKANAQYFTWKSELIRITKEKTGEPVVKINDEEAVKWYNDGFTAEQTFRETWQSDGD